MQKFIEDLFPFSASISVTIYSYLGATLPRLVGTILPGLVYVVRTEGVLAEDRKGAVRAALTEAN